MKVHYCIEARAGSRDRELVEALETCWASRAGTMYVPYASHASSSFNNTDLRLSRPAATRVAILARLSACLGEALGFPLMKAFASRAAVVAPGVSSWFVTGFLLTARFLLAALVLSFHEHKLPSRSELSQGLWIGDLPALGTFYRRTG